MFCISISVKVRNWPPQSHGPIPGSHGMLPQRKRHFLVRIVDPTVLLPPAPRPSPSLPCMELSTPSPPLSRTPSPSPLSPSPPSLPHMFPNVSTLATISLSAPVSTASVERSFSHMKQLKTHLRNRFKGYIQAFHT